MSASSKKRPSRRPTVHDIAREAKVSIGTVSRALNNSDNVNAETRERVLDISRRLGMRSRSPVKGKHFAVLMPDRDRVVTGGYVDSLVYELLHALSAREAALFVFTDSQAEELPRCIFDGIFNVSWTQESLDLLGSIRETPIIAFNRSADTHFHVVGWNNQAEGRMVADYFLARGHQRLAFIGTNPPGAQANPARLTGYRAACAKAGFPLDDARVELLEDRSRLSLALKRAIDHRADAIFIPGLEKLAIESLTILQSLLGLRVPEDVSVIGGENPGWSDLFNPPLTTVDTPLDLLAKGAVDHMFDLLEHRPRRATETYLLKKIIERKSVRTRTA